MAHPSDVTTMAVFCDFENVALGVRDAKYEKFDIRKVLERLLLKGSIVVKKAYCDWERYKAFKAPMHEAAFEMIEIPHVRQSGKNSADIRLVVDALDLCYTKSHVSTFVIVSGDSDFSPLVSKLRENDKRVIGVGVKNSTSDLLIANCDEFIYYDDLVREGKPRAPRKTAAKKAAPAPAEAAKEPQNGTAKEAPKATREPAEPVPPAAPAKGAKAAKKTPSRARKSRKGAAEPAADAAAAETSVSTDDAAPPMPEPAVEPPREPPSDEDRAQQAFDLVTRTLEALMAERGGDERIWGSMVKQAIKRVNPGFAESYYGFRSFNALLEEAAARGLLALERDGKSGGYLLRLPVNED